MIPALSSLRLFFSLCALLGAAFVYQTIFNTGVPIYGSLWFAALGLLLAANIAACSLRRLRTAAPYFLLIHAGLVLVIAGAFATRLLRFEGELPLRAGETSDIAYRGGAAYRLPFSVKLDSFRVEYYDAPRSRLAVEDAKGRREFDAAEGAVIKLPEAGAEIKVLRLLRDFGITAQKEVVEKSGDWRNPAAQLEISLGRKKARVWAFANFQGMNAGDLPLRVLYSVDRGGIKNFTSEVAVSPAPGGTVTGAVAVNKPLKVGGYTLYQTSYDPADPDYSLLTVTSDRGAGIVYAGFAALLIGVLLWLRK